MDLKSFMCYSHTLQISVYRAIFSANPTDITILHPDNNITDKTQIVSPRSFISHIALYMYCSVLYCIVHSKPVIGHTL